MAAAREVGSSSMGCRVIAQGYKVLDERRHAVDYRPSIWGDHFIKNPTPPHTNEKSLEWMEERRDVLINEAKKALTGTHDPMAEMKLIDAVQRLGISYHFQDEIHASLQKLKSTEFDNKSFHQIALQFWLLRQERYYVSCDVFQSFMDNQQNLKVSLHSDVRALLALYEAAHLGTPNEQLLTYAQRQSTSLLKSMVDRLEKPLANKVRHALQTPSFRRMKSKFIVKKSRKYTSKCIAVKWYHGLESPQKLFYARHRPTEAYFWALGVYYEPQYGKVRKLLAKFIATITLYDDTFDKYGIWEELQPFADVMQRWDMKEVENLNGCYSDFARFMFGTMIEIENALPKDTGRRNANFIRAIVGNVTEELLKWMSKFPQIGKDSCIISRLMDDIVAHEFETERNNVATAVTCYMKEYKTTKEEASEVLWGLVENAWKSMNHEYLTWTSIPSQLLIRVIKLARMMETMYKDIDGYTDSKILKKWISVLLDEPIHI
ncbi:hypothetical protein C2845_PM02G23470 [Panicum miliaceum]|uniref:Uncharacterized protein n=1 Tax=Panicum miliaceum TaxID=4540 RepID=A0A3L6SAV2_PANMI|nr:hypothetical protein C2845_PM02G23470 [Panicum miliaceum]